MACSGNLLSVLAGCFNAIEFWLFGVVWGFFCFGFFLDIKPLTILIVLNSANTNIAVMSCDGKPTLSGPANDAVVPQVGVAWVPAAGPAFKQGPRPGDLHHCDGFAHLVQGEMKAAGTAPEGVGPHQELPPPFWDRLRSMLIAQRVARSLL